MANSFVEAVRVFYVKYANANPPRATYAYMSIDGKHWLTNHVVFTVDSTSIRRPFDCLSKVIKVSDVTR